MEAAESFDVVLGFLIQRGLYGVVFMLVIASVLWAHYRVFVTPHIAALADQVSYLRERVETLERRMDIGGKP